MGEDDVVGRVAAWWPAGVVPSNPVPADVALTRPAVADAGPRSWREAGKVLRYCWDYLAYRITEGLPVEPAVAFAPAEVDAYREVLAGPVGTRNAVCSHLRRLHPDVGLAGTTRPSGTDDGRTAAEACVVALHPLPPAVAAVLAEHRPQLLGPETWDLVSGFTRAVVAAAAPQRPQRARDLLVGAAYLSAWVHGQHRPLTEETVLAARTIEDFLTLLLDGGRSVRGVATLAANLHAVRDAHGLPCDVARRRFPAPATKVPYDADEVDGLYAEVARIPNATRRRHLGAVLAVLFGIGAYSGECGWVTPDAVVTCGGAVWVGLCVPTGWDPPADPTAAGALAGAERRWVQVSDDYADKVLAAQTGAVANGDRFLIGGTSLRRNDRVGRLAHGSTGQWRVNLDTTRTRATWLVEAAAGGRYPVITDLLDAAGATSLERLAGVLDEIRDRAAAHGEDVLLGPAVTAFAASVEVDEDIAKGGAA